MFIIAGISPKLKPLGAARGFCPVCQSETELALIHKYMTPHIFFIPTFRFHSEYVATCGHCAAVLNVNAEKARAFTKDPAVYFNGADFQVVKKNI